MADTGFLHPTVGTQGAGWLNPGNILSDDGAVASTNGTQTSTGNLRALTYGIELSGNAPSGIEVEFEITASTGTGTLFVGITFNGIVTVGLQKSQGLTPGVFNLGGASDLWTTGATEALLEQTTTGVLFQMDSTLGATLSIDYAFLKIYWPTPVTDEAKNRQGISPLRWTGGRG